MKITDYENVIRESVQIESEDDENWGWYVTAIGDNKVSIRWGYFDYIEESLNIVIRVDEISNGKNDTEYMIVACLPCHNEYGVLVGKHFWDDCDNLEDGFIIAIDKIVKLAKKLY